MDAIFDFSYFPVLETERLRLRQLTHADADAIIGIFGNPDVLRYMDDEPILTTEGALERIDWLDGRFRNHEAMRWGITLKRQDAVIGTCGFYAWRKSYRRVDIGYDLQPPYWGQGYATEAAHCLVRWCFLNLNLHRVQADCTAGNIGSERTLEKVGFTLEGIWRESCFEHERFVDIKQYGLLRREYLPGE